MPEIDATQRLRAGAGGTERPSIGAPAASGCASDAATYDAAAMPDDFAESVKPAPLDPAARKWAAQWAAAPAGNPVTATLPASADAVLIAQFDARVAAMFALLDAALVATQPFSVDALRHALHQLAGTAAFFGQIALGMLAGDFDDRLAGGSAIATPAFLQDARTQLRAAAAGA